MDVREQVGIGARIYMPTNPYFTRTPLGASPTQGEAINYGRHRERVEVSSDDGCTYSTQPIYKAVSFGQLTSSSAGSQSKP